MTTVRRIPRLSLPRHAVDHLIAMVDPLWHQRHTLLVVTTDADDSPVDHFAVVDSSADVSASEGAAVLTSLAVRSAGIAGAAPSGLLLALTRPGDEAVQPLDRIWFRAFHRVCHTRGYRPLGVYIVGGHGVRSVQIDDAA
jgi:hypothetical protein